MEQNILFKVTYFVLKVINYRRIEQQNKDRKVSEEIARHQFLYIYIRAAHVVLMRNSRLNLRFKRGHIPHDRFLVEQS